MGVVQGKDGGARGTTDDGSDKPDRRAKHINPNNSDNNVEASTVILVSHCKVPRPLDVFLQESAHVPDHDPDDDGIEKVRGPS